MRTLSHSSEMRFVIQGCCSFFKKKRGEEEEKKKKKRNHPQPLKFTSSSPNSAAFYLYRVIHFIRASHVVRLTYFQGHWGFEGRSWFGVWRKNEPSGLSQAYAGMVVKLEEEKGVLMVTSLTPTTSWRNATVTAAGETAHLFIRWTNMILFLHSKPSQLLFSSPFQEQRRARCTKE